jgi:hypothetical protein
MTMLLILTALCLIEGALYRSLPLPTTAQANHMHHEEK